MSYPQQILIEQFIKERREALLGMDKDAILAYAQKWGLKNIPTDNDEVFWAAIHKARTALTDLPIEDRRKSKTWLTEHGFGSWDDGDL